MMARLAKVFSLIGGLLVALMVVGLLLPGTWTAEAVLEIDAPREEVYPLLVDLARWDEWTQWGEVQSTLSDPSSGAGAVRAWDDADYGAGSVSIVETRLPERVRYRVAIGERAEVLGLLTLAESDAGTVVTWREEGDFGRNPLMGYVARGMADSQGRQLADGLERLKAVVSGTPSG